MSTLCQARFVPRALWRAAPRKERELEHPPCTLGRPCFPRGILLLTQEPASTLNLIALCQELVRCSSRTWAHKISNTCASPGHILQLWWRTKVALGFERTLLPRRTAAHTGLKARFRTHRTSQASATPSSFQVEVLRRKRVKQT